MATDELSAKEIHKLKQFSHALPDEQDKLDQLKNVNIDAIVDATGVSRRNVLQVILGLAAGSVVGGLSAQEIVQAVEADASTTDSDGNVGLPGDRVDLYADGIDSNVLSTGEITTGTLSHKNPFSPRPQIDVLTGPDRWRSSADFAITDDYWVICWIEGEGHNHNGNLLKVATSVDGGSTFDNEQILFGESDGGEYARDSHMEEMDNGRLGIWFKRMDDSDNHLSLSFAYSDDGGLTWSVDNYNGFNSTFPAVTINKYPSSVGGSDNGGWITFGDDVYTGGNTIYAISTTDNGDTWSEQSIITDANGPGWEVSVERLGGTDRWLMTTRRWGSSDPNYVYKSTDLTTWTGPNNAPTPTIGNNPSTLIYQDGYVTWLAASRPYQYEDTDGRAIPVNGQVFQGIVSRTAEADSIWNDPTAWPDWEVAAHVPHIHGDFGFDTESGHVFGIMGMNEHLDSNKDGSAQLAVLSSSDAPLPEQAAQVESFNGGSTGDGCRVYAGEFTSDTYNIPNDTYTQTQFTGATFEDENVAIDLPNDEITIFTPGRYRLVYNFGVRDINDGLVTGRILVNGSEVADASYDGGGYPNPNVMDVRDLDRGDVITASIRQQSGSDAESQYAENRHFLAVTLERADLYSEPQ